MRHIRELCPKAGSSYLKGLHREVHETMKKMVTKCAICAQVLDFSGRNNARNNLLAYGFCRIEINKHFHTKFYFVARLQVQICLKFPKFSSTNLP